MRFLIGIVIGVVLAYAWRRRSQDNDDLWAGFDTLQATGMGAAQDIAQRATSAAQQVGQQASATVETVRSQAASAAPQAAGAVQGGAEAVQRARETAQQVAERLAAAAKQAGTQQRGAADQAAGQVDGGQPGQADQGASEQQAGGDSGGSGDGGQADQSSGGEGQPSEGQGGGTAMAGADAIDGGHESQDVAVDTSPLSIDTGQQGDVRQEFAWLRDFGEGDIPRAAVLRGGDELEGWEQYVDISQPGQELIQPGAFGKHVPEGRVYVARSRVPEDVWYRLIRLEAR